MVAYILLLGFTIAASANDDEVRKVAALAKKDTKSTVNNPRLEKHRFDAFKKLSQSDPDKFNKMLDYVNQKQGSSTPPEKKKKKSKYSDCYNEMEQK